MHQYKELLNMQKHMEGGYFAEFYHSQDKVIPTSSRYGENAQRDAGSSIYYLLEAEDFSVWHRIKSDEIWHYYDGDSAVNIYAITPEGEWRTFKLGNPTYDEEASFQVMLPAGTWFAANLEDQVSFALMGCTVSPGFEYKDFEIADRAVLAKKYPQYEHYINKFCREEVK